MMRPNKRETASGHEMKMQAGARGIYWHINVQRYIAYVLKSETGGVGSGLDTLGREYVGAFPTINEAHRARERRLAYWKGARRPRMWIHGS